MSINLETAYGKGKILYHPELKVLIQITSIISNRNYPLDNYNPWVHYAVIIPIRNRYDALGKYFSVGNRDNSWDRFNIIGNEFIDIDSNCGAVPKAVKLLYGKGKV